MGGRAFLVILAGVILLSSRMFFNITWSSTDIAANAEASFAHRTARNIAQSGLNMSLRQLANDPTWRTGFPLTDMMSGKFTVSASETSYASQHVVQLVSIGIAGYGTESENRDTVVAYVGEGGYVPSALKGVITTVGQVVTHGTLVVDGRDHSLFGTLIAGQGTLGVWTTSTLLQKDNSKIGGFSSGIPYLPSAPADTHSFAMSQTLAGPFPGTPDSVLGGASMGYPEGFMKYVARSGLSGSQYVTDPATLSYPLKGMTYVELPPGTIVESMSINGSGILVIHNPSRDAMVKELNSGTFKGLMLVDHTVHLHATLLGGLVVLSPAPVLADSTNDEDGSMLFSSEAVKNAVGLVRSLPGKSSSSNVVAWWE
jgi:hypothetical protein